MSMNWSFLIKKKTDFVIIHGIDRIISIQQKYFIFWQNTVNIFWRLSKVYLSVKLLLFNVFIY